MIKKRKHTRLHSILRNMADLDEYQGIFRLLNKQQDISAKRRGLYCLKASMVVCFFAKFSLTWTVKPCCMDINKTKKMQK